MDFRVSHNIRQVERGLSDFARRQLPFATALALTRTARDIKANSEKRLRRRLDRPTPFTLRAFAVRRATKRRLAAEVFAKDRQAAYLSFAEDGGTRRPKGEAIVVPAERTRRNRYGNMPRGAIGRALARGDTFSGDPAGPRGGGIWKRVGRKGRGGLRLVADYAKRAVYRPRLGFEDGAVKTTRARLPAHLTAALAHAIRTARR